jgi:hypothetical protein
MSQSKRPGGLTALAVINFVWGGFGCIGVFAMMAAIALIKGGTNVLNEVAANDESISVTTVAEPGLTAMYVSLILAVVTAALLIVSGIGYLGLKKTMGFKMGNLYGIISILSSIFSIMAASQGFGIMSIIGFIYPAVTLLLLNTTFKEDFVN